MSDWDAAKYHRISDPQLAWGRAVAARLSPVSGERILDLGCGTGRLTAEIARTPGIQRGWARPVGRDAARGGAPAGVRPTFTRGRRSDPGCAGAGSQSLMCWRTGRRFRSSMRFDAVFSAATFHWIPDHGRLFSEHLPALKRGGRLVAQAGGAGNLEQPVRPRGAADAIACDTRASTSRGRAESLRKRERHGSATPTRGVPGFRGDARSGAGAVCRRPEAYAEFVAAVCLRHQLDRLPSEGRGAIHNGMTEEATETNPPLTLDYWRLNISARKAGA